ncbi:MAG: hypothetical protein R3D58_14690 [Saprospiraceae bacterium]
MKLLATLMQVMPVFAIIGTFLLILAYDRKNLVERVKSKGIEAEGTVVEMRQNPGSLFSAVEGEGEAPVVDFTTDWGTHRHYSTHYMTASPYNVGQKVKLWYYFYKSRRDVALETDPIGILPPGLFRWGVLFCLLGYPFLLKKLMLLGNF